MKKRILITAATLIGVAALVAGIGALSSWRASAYASGAASLAKLWHDDEMNGIPAAKFASWSDQVEVWKKRWQFAPAWIWADGQGQLSDLRHQTDALYTKTIATNRADATKNLASLKAFLTKNALWITVADSAAASRYSASLTAAKTPAALTTLNHQITGTVASLKKKVADIQASLNADIADRGGAAGVIRAAIRDIATAQADNLDVGTVPTLLDNVQAQGAGDQPTQAVVELDQALNQLEARITVNDQIYSSLHTQLWNLDAILAMGTPNAPTLQTQYNKAQDDFKNASTDAQLAAISGEVTALQNAIDSEKKTNACGHNVGSGKVITISLSLQELVFYQDGCAVRDTPITSGRPALPTPTGTFHVFLKKTPFQMISPWPKESPYYYEPTWVKWVMEFAGGGYFLHDAYWESLSQYGPGGQYGGGASHGCVHIPTDTMQWAYSWTPTGTPVIISG